jgi:hypothetical protein
MTNENENTDFYEKVRQSELSIAEGREIPELNVAGPQDKQEEDALNAQQAQRLANAPQEVPKEEQPTDKELGAAEGEQAPEPDTSLAAQSKEAPNRATGNNNLTRPLNIIQENPFDYPDAEVTGGAHPAEQLPSQDELVEQMEPQEEEDPHSFIKQHQQKWEKKVEGKVVKPEEQTYASDKTAEQEFNTDNFSIHGKDARETKGAIPFNINTLNSFPIRSPVVSQVVNVREMHLGGDTKLKLGADSIQLDFSGGKATSFGEPQKIPELNNLKTQEGGLTHELRETYGSHTLFDYPLNSMQLFEKPSKPRVKGREALGLVYGQDNKPNPPGKPSEEIDQENADFFGQFGQFPTRLGKALGTGISNLGSEEDAGPLEEFVGGFQKGYQEPLLDYRDSENKNKAMGIGQTVNATFGSIAELGSDAIWALANTTRAPSSLEEFIFGYNHNEDKSFYESFAQRFKVYAKDNRASQAVWSQLDEGQPGDAPGDPSYFDASFGEFGKGTLGFLNYILSMPQNQLMALGNKLFDIYQNGPTNSENVFQQALIGRDYTLMGPPSEDKTHYTPIAKNPEDRKLWQYGVAFVGDVAFGGFVDAGIGTLFKTGARAARNASNLAHSFNYNTPNFMDDIQQGLPGSSAPSVLPKSGQTSGTVSIPTQNKGSYTQPNQPANNFSVFDYSQFQVSKETNQAPPTTIDISNNTGGGNATITKAPESSEADYVLTVKPKGKPKQKTTPSGKEAKAKDVTAEEPYQEGETNITTYANPKGEGLTPKGAKQQEGGAYQKPVVNKELRDRLKKTRKKAADERKKQADIDFETMLNELEHSQLARTQKALDMVDPNKTTVNMDESNIPSVWQLTRPQRALDKVDTVRLKPVPEIENLNAKRSREQLTNLARRNGHVKQNRQTPLTDEELNNLQQSYGRIYSEHGKPLDDQVLDPANEAPEVATKLPSSTTGEPGLYRRLFIQQPAEDELDPTRKYQFLITNQEKQVEDTATGIIESIDNPKLYPEQAAVAKDIQTFTGNIKQLLNNIENTNFSQEALQTAEFGAKELLVKADDLQGVLARTDFQTPIAKGATISKDITLKSFRRVRDKLLKLNDNLEQTRPIKKRAAKAGKTTANNAPKITAGGMRNITAEVRQVTDDLENTDLITTVKRASKRGIKDTVNGVKKLSKQVKKLSELRARADPETLAQDELQNLAPRSHQKALPDTVANRIEAERRADVKSQDARLHQGEAEAATRVKAGRQEYQKRQPEGLERQDINEEAASQSYNKVAVNAVDEADPETIKARAEALTDESQRLSGKTFYHGTKVDLQSLQRRPEDNLFSTVDPEKGGSSSNMGVGVHMTDTPEVAEQYAKAQKTPHQPDIPEKEYIPEGQVIETGITTRAPLRADVKTQQLPNGGEDVRNVFKKVGRAHMPNKKVASSYASKIRKNRTVEGYYESFRKTLADNNEMSEQRVRAFQRDITSNLRKQGYDALYKTEKGGSESINSLIPENVQTTAVNRSAGSGDALVNKQARKYVDDLSDNDTEVAEANRTQSDISLARGLEKEHSNTHDELAEEAVEAQDEANEMDIQAREETQEARETELESAEEGLEEDFEELVKQEQNPSSEEILEQQINKEIADLEESLGTPEANRQLTETEIEEAEEIEELYNDLYKLAVETDNVFDETQFKQIGAIKNYDGQVKDEIIETLMNNGVLEEDGITLSLSANSMGEINWKMIKGNLSDCI